jgi:hypothetical protein
MGDASLGNAELEGPLISVSRFASSVWSVPLSVVWPCIAEWGWSRQRVIGLVRRRAGLPVMSVEIRASSPTASTNRSPRDQAGPALNAPLGRGAPADTTSQRGSRNWPSRRRVRLMTRLASCTTDC